MESQYIKRSPIQHLGAFLTDRALGQIGQIFLFRAKCIFCLFVFGVRVYDRNTVHLVLFKFLDIYFCLLIPSPRGVDET